MFPCDDEGYYCFDKDSHYVETWKAMEALVDKGKAKTIGLSNFNRSQVAEILSIPGLKYQPAVLQNESHPYLQEKDLRDFCKINGIAFQVTETMIILIFKVELFYIQILFHAQCKTFKLRLSMGCRGWLF